MKSLYRDSLSPHVIKMQVPIVGYCISSIPAFFAYNNVSSTNLCLTYYIKNQYFIIYDQNLSH